MQQELVTQPEIKLIGLSVRTRNQDEFNPETAKIGKLFGQFLSQNISNQIPHRKNPGVIFSTYTNYESDYQGAYTYFIGEEVSDFKNIPEGLEPLIIPASRYLKFTTGPGKLPDIVISAWQEIWGMAENKYLKTIHLERIYQADFEIYDHRCADANQAIVDIYLGVKG